MAGKPGQRRKAWWTRERMIDAGARFYRERGCAPTNDAWWQTETQFNANTPDGRSNVGSTRPYPSNGPLNKYWKGMRAFWQAVAKAYPELEIVIDKGDMPWSALEEWFVTESVGIIPRTEVARLMAESGVGRTEPAIKRRLYELGINSYNRWGWTINRLAQAIGVSGAVIEKYIDHGRLPFFQGNKCLYIEPADFFVIQEYDWSKKKHPRDLAEAVRKSLMQRLCYLVLGFDWRKYSYHQIQKRRDFFTGRIKKPRAAQPATELKPTHIKIGDWVAITGPWAKQPGAQGRVGQVKNLVWSPTRMAANQKRPGRPACWVATVEFKKLKAHGRPEYPRTRYNVPASSIERSRKPYEPVKDLKPQRDRSKRGARLKSVGQVIMTSRLNVVREDQAA